VHKETCKHIFHVRTNTYISFDATALAFDINDGGGGGTNCAMLTSEPRDAAGTAINIFISTLNNKN
jgi:hypothetical protein